MIFKIKKLLIQILLTILFPLEWRWVWQRGAGM